MKTPENNHKNVDDEDRPPVEETKPKYQAPLVLPLGNVLKGQGQQSCGPGSAASGGSGCNAGTGASSPPSCHTGTAASGSTGCHVGNSAVGRCHFGSLASGRCRTGQNAA